MTGERQGYTRGEGLGATRWGKLEGKFSGTYAHQVITGDVGHNLPQEAPQAFAKAVVDVDGY